VLIAEFPEVRWHVYGLLTLCSSLPPVFPPVRTASVARIRNPNYVEVRAEAERRQDELDDLVGAFEGRADTPTDLAAEYKRYLWNDRYADPSTAAKGE